MADKKSKMTLIASKDKKPDVQVKPGQELRVTAVSIQGPDLAKIKEPEPAGLKFAISFEPEYGGVAKS